MKKFLLVALTVFCVASPALPAENPDAVFKEAAKEALEVVKKNPKVFSPKVQRAFTKGFTKFRVTYAPSISEGGVFRHVTCYKGKIFFDHYFSLLTRPRQLGLAMHAYMMSAKLETADDFSLSARLVNVYEQSSGTS